MSAPNLRFGTETSLLLSAGLKAGNLQYRSAVMDTGIVDKQHDTELWLSPSFSGFVWWFANAQRPRCFIFQFHCTIKQVSEALGVATCLPDKLLSSLPCHCQLTTANCRASGIAPWVPPHRITSSCHSSSWALVTQSTSDTPASLTSTENTVQGFAICWHSGNGSEVCCLCV